MSIKSAAEEMGECLRARGCLLVTASAAEFVYTPSLQTVVHRNADVMLTFGCRFVLRCTEDLGGNASSRCLLIGQCSLVRKNVI